MKSFTDVLKRMKRSEPPRRQGKYTSVRSERPGREAPSTDSSPFFKRGRTMPGTTLHGMRTTDKHALRSATPREKVRHLSYVRQVIMTTLTVVVIAAAILFIIVQQFSATIHVVALNGGKPLTITTTPYVAAIQDYLKQHPLERLRFALDSQSLASAVQASRPEVAAVHQTGNDGFATTRFVLDMRQPVVSWDVADTRYYVDAEGVSFTKNYFAEPRVHIVDNSGIRYTPGTAIASERFLSFVGRIIAFIEQEGSLSVTKVEIPTGTTRQVKLYFKGVKYPALVSIERGPAEQAEDIARSIKYMRSHHKQPRYIDVRVKGKAFYRE